MKQHILLPTIDAEHAGIRAADLALYSPELREEHARLHAAATSLYADDRASINLPLDLSHLRMCQRLARKHKGASLLIIVGIGGSNLGTMAVQEAILGKLYDLDASKRPRVLYADTVGTAHVVSVLEAQLRARKRVVINLISKSGSTTESIANFEVLLACMQRLRPRDWRDSVVVTTDEDSHLWSLAKQERFALLPIPKNVGGRYSVLSPVGLFPLALLGIDTRKLLDGAAHMRAACLRSEPHENPAMLRAVMLAKAYEHKRTIADNFYFKADLESVGKWYRQLMGESVGKEWDREHTRRVWTGMTPTVSIGSTDLHSMAQLYFGGPHDKFHTLFVVSKWRDDVRLPDMHLYESLVPNIQRKKLSAIMGAIQLGVRATLREQKRPHCVITLPDISEQSVGALLQLHMMEMMYLAAIFDVNAFDQPNVESYKRETKRILARKKKE